MVPALRTSPVREDAATPLKGGPRKADLLPQAARTRRAAEEARCAYADVFGVWKKVLERKDLPSLLANNINHPGEFGHGLYFEALKAVEF